MNRILELLICVPTVLIALTFHECAHGFVAYKLGDPTAKAMGRLSLNPIKHLDPIGAICMLLCGFGWARPVPIDPRYFKYRKLGMAISALAGPLSNLLLAFFGCLLYSFSWNLLSGHSFHTNFIYYLALAWLTFIENFAWLNIALAIFNLIPLPPLDGSRIFSVFLPEKQYFGLMRYESYIAIGFFIILLVDSRFLGGILTGWLSFLVNFVFNGMSLPFDLIFGLIF